MDESTFVSTWKSVLDGLIDLCHAADRTPELVGLLTLDDFALFCDLVKELRWNREV